MRQRMIPVGLAFAGALLIFPGCSAAVHTPVADEDSPRQAARGQADDREKAKAREEKGEPFKLPEDQAGQMLSRILPPTERVGPLDNPGRVVPPLPPPPNFTGTLPPLPTIEPPAPQLPLARPKKQARPHLVVPESFGGEPVEPSVPVKPAFTTENRTRVESEDVVIPPPLPVLAAPMVDRAPLDDATTEASLESVLASPVPVRVNLVPFQKVGVPDPFENRKPLTVEVPTEKKEPESGPPQVGKP